MNRKNNNDFNRLIKNAIDKKALKDALSNEKSRREIMTILNKIKY